MRRAHLPRCLVLVVAILLAAACPAGAAEEGTNDARRLYNEATAAFGVGSYSEAAEKYEASFKLHPEPALLYNAAQAYRMAGNKQRALQLYRNFVRLYGSNPRADDARNHAAALEKAIAEGDKSGATAAPTTPEPPARTSAPPPAPLPAPGLTAPPPQREQATALVQQPAPPASGSDEERPSLVSRPWFWVAIGAVVAGSTVAILLATRKDTYPDPSLGKLD
jgi:tetratricopeptide (TPR) repeat protein